MVAWGCIRHYDVRMNTPNNDTVGQRFFEPVDRFLRSANTSRDCPDFTDQHFLYSGIRRVISNTESGRAWVQHWRSVTQTTLGVVNFFASLKSPRRLALVRELDEFVRADVDALRQTTDPFLIHKELADFALYAADGHFHEASVHDKRDEDGQKPLVEHFFALNMRTHTLRHLDVARPEKKREHDLTALRRFGQQTLRMGEKAGRKVVFVYDRAIVDFVQWIEWKKKSGIYVISREKENMKLQVVGVLDWDRSDPRNAGVIADEYVGTFSGVMIRRVQYVDPVTGKTFAFLTSEFTIPPGLIALLYRHRWDIEKIFDEIKNKFFERKAWAANDNAKCQHALFCCLAHNLLLLMEFRLDKENGITETKLEQKRQRRKEILMAANPHMIIPLTINRITQRSLQFIRWLRYALDFHVPWNDALTSLQPIMKAYL